MLTALARRSAPAARRWLATNAAPAAAAAKAAPAASKAAAPEAKPAAAPKAADAKGATADTAKGADDKAADKPNKAAGLSPAATETSGESSMHSSDIAFKPTIGGWGYNPQFATNFDDIFGKKKPRSAAPAKPVAPAAAAPVAAVRKPEPSSGALRVLRDTLSAHGENDDVRAILEGHGWTKGR